MADLLAGIGNYFSRMVTDKLRQSRLSPPAEDPAPAYRLELGPASRRDHVELPQPTESIADRVRKEAENLTPKTDVTDESAGDQSIDIGSSTTTKILLNAATALVTQQLPDPDRAHVLTSF
jgi:hypothetical protein